MPCMASNGCPCANTLRRIENVAANELCGLLFGLASGQRFVAGHHLAQLDRGYRWRLLSLHPEIGVIKVLSFGTFKWEECRRRYENQKTITTIERSFSIPFGTARVEVASSRSPLR